MVIRHHLGSLEGKLISPVEVVVELLKVDKNHCKPRRGEIRDSVAI
jgi:hypothetical protein